jgi:hypothetical protein
MSTNKFTVAALIAAAFFTASGALAQTTSASPVSAASEINYVSQLPTPSELSRAQPPAGARVSRISQTSAEVSVTYLFSNGQTQVVSYRLLAAAADAPSTTLTSPPTTVAQPPAVLQPTTPPPVYYYDAPPAVVYQVAPAPYYDRQVYYPYYPWYPALSLGFNFGFRGGHGYGGGFRGGFRH